MSLLSEPIYCAEQIQIPPNLGEILKAYSKEVIRQNPPDIIEFSARYFEQLCQNWDEEPPFERQELIPLYQQLSKVGTEQISMQEFRTASEIAGLPSDAVDRVYQLRQFEEGENTDWKELLVLVCTLVSQDRESLIELLFQVFGSDNDGALPASVFAQLFEYIQRFDRTITQDLVDRVNALTHTDGDIVFEDYMAIMRE